MKKFSKIEDNKEPRKSKDKVIFTDSHLSIIKYEDWSVIKEKDAVFCIPYLIESNQLILRYEYIPTFKYIDGQEYHITLVGGGIEQGETPKIAITRELEEEAGIVLNNEYILDDMKPFFISKGVANKYHTFIIPLTENDYTEVVPKGDGSRIEKISKSVKVDAKYLKSLNVSDLLTEYMLMKLSEYLSL